MVAASSICRNWRASTGSRSSTSWRFFRRRMANCLRRLRNSDSIKLTCKISWISQSSTSTSINRSTVVGRRRTWHCRRQLHRWVRPQRLWRDRVASRCIRVRLSRDQGNTQILAAPSKSILQRMLLRRKMRLMNWRAMQARTCCLIVIRIWIIRRNLKRKSTIWNRDYPLIVQNWMNIRPKTSS